MERETQNAETDAHLKAAAVNESAYRRASQLVLAKAKHYAEVNHDPDLAAALHMVGHELAETADSWAQGIERAATGELGKLHNLIEGVRLWWQRHTDKVLPR